MLIERHETLDAEGAEPIISGVVAIRNLVFVKGVTAAPVGDITDQTRLVLQEIDRLLAVAGTDKSKLLSAQVCGNIRGNRGTIAGGDYGRPTLRPWPAIAKDSGQS